MSHAPEEHLPAHQENNSEKDKYHAFVNLALTLAAVTGIELVLVYLPFSETFILTTLVLLSGFKFVAVIAWFMHLIYDQLLFTLCFGAGFVIATGTVIALIFLMSPGKVDFDAINAF